MLEGLEISVLSLEEALSENDMFRIDGEYFRRQYLKEDSVRTLFKNAYLGAISFITDGQHGYHEVDENSQIAHLTAKNFKYWFADKNGADGLAQWVHDKNQRSALQINDIILTTRGSVGYCALVTNAVLPANIDQDVARIVLNEDAPVCPNYVIAYLNSDFGQDWIKRNCTGMVQQGLSLGRIREMPIPILSNPFQQKIEALVKSAHTAQESSKSLYQTAENLLLSALGIDESIFKVSKNEVVTNEKSFADLEDAFRFDSEYYQPKYDLIHEKIKSYKGGFAKLEQCLKELQTGEYAGEYQTKNESLSYFIRNTNVKKTQIVVDENYAVLPDNFKKFTQEGDILTARVGAIGLFGVVRKDSANCVYSDNVLNIRLIDTLNPEVYCCYFSTKVNFELVDRIAGGSVQPLITQTSIKDLVIPIFPNEIQTSVLTKIQESFSLKTHSEHLLNLAKRAVEIAIEEGEEVAMGWMGNNE